MRLGPREPEPQRGHPCPVAATPTHLFECIRILDGLVPRKGLSGNAHNISKINDLKNRHWLACTKEMYLCRLRMITMLIIAPGYRVCHQPWGRPRIDDRASNGIKPRSSRDEMLVIAPARGGHVRLGAFEEFLELLFARVAVSKDAASRLIPALRILRHNKPDCTADQSPPPSENILASRVGHAEPRTDISSAAPNAMMRFRSHSASEVSGAANRRLGRPNGFPWGKAP
jgi:hypothetical protein